MAGRPRSLIIAALAGIWLTSCRQGDAEQPSVSANEITENVPQPPAPVPTLDRAGLLGAIAAAAATHSAGTDDTPVQRKLAGRRFTLRMPFACPGIESAAGDPFALTVRPDGRSYEIRAEPSVSAAEVGIAVANGEPAGTVEAIEGFWIERPWLLAGTCPPPQVETDAATAPRPPAEAEERPVRAPLGPSPEPERTAGIVQIITDADSRVGLRSGRDYRVVVRLAEGEARPAGLVLLVEGRLRAWPGGKVVRCIGRGVAARPACVAAADVDRVAFVRIDNGEVLSEWVK
jgi:hypothetical protein